MLPEWRHIHAGTLKHQDRCASPAFAVRRSPFAVRRSSLVAREALLARLDNGLDGKLTLLSAPAGFGKTTLVTAWITARSLPSAWVSLDEGDNDPVRFWRYVIAACAQATPGTECA